MKKLSALFFILVFLLTACQPATAYPLITAKKGEEFILAPDQTAIITDTGLSIRLVDVTSDERCPSEIECAISGPVSISLSVEINNGSAANINLQTFTSNDGSTPPIQFEGVEDRIVYEGYLIQVTSVLPYPASPEKPIKDSEYRVTLKVTEE